MREGRDTNISFEIPPDIEQEVRTDGLDMNREAREAYLVKLLQSRRVTSSRACSHVAIGAKLLGVEPDQSHFRPDPGAIEPHGSILRFGARYEAGAVPPYSKLAGKESWILRRLTRRRNVKVPCHFVSHDPFVFQGTPPIQPGQSSPGLRETDFLRSWLTLETGPLCFH